MDFGNNDDDPFQMYLNRADVGLGDYDSNNNNNNNNINPLNDSLLDGEFCTPANLSSCIQYINNTLDSFGFPPSLPSSLSLSTDSSSSSFSSSSLSVDAIVQLVNTIYSLLQKHQKDVDFRSDASDRVRRLQADKEQAQSMTKRWEERANTAEKELSFLIKKERSKEEMVRKMKEKWESEKEEMTKMISSLQHRDSQAQHEIRKKEREYVRLHERLQHILNERNREVKAGMEGKKRAGWKMQGGKNIEDEMYKMIITTYENKQQELVQETNDLRSSLRELQSELQQLLNQHQPSNRIPSTAATTPSRVSSSSLSSLSPSSSSLTPSKNQILTSEFDLPFSLARETIEEKLRAQMQKYRELMSSPREKEEEEREEEEMPDYYKSKLEEFKKIMEEQAQLVRYVLQVSPSSPLPLPLSPSSLSPSIHPSSSSFSSSTPTNQMIPSSSSSSSSSSLPSSLSSSSPPRVLFPVYPNTPGRYKGLDDSTIELEERLLEEERKLFEDQKKHFEEERRRVSVMAVELAKERMELEELRQQLGVNNNKIKKEKKERPPVTPSRRQVPDNGLSESFLHELEQVSLQDSINNYFISNDIQAPPSPISFNLQ